MVVLHLQPTGLMLGITGLSTSYDDAYPRELEDVLSELEWLEAMHRINRSFQDRFPCVPCRLQAYCCCPCTLGLSLLTIRDQAKDIEQGARGVIGYVNQNLKARKRDVRFDLKRKCCRSWIEVEYEAAASTFRRNMIKTDVQTDSEFVVIRDQPNAARRGAGVDSFLVGSGVSGGARVRDGVGGGGSSKTSVRSSGSFADALM